MMIQDCSVTNNMTNDAKKMINQPLHLIEIILVKHQEAILEVCKEQQDKIKALEAERDEWKRQAESHWTIAEQGLVLAQARIVQMREALMSLNSPTAQERDAAIQIYEEALAIQDDTTALDALLAAEREKCARVCDENQDHYCKCAAAIRELK